MLFSAIFGCIFWQIEFFIYFSITVFRMPRHHVRILRDRILNFQFSRKILVIKTCKYLKSCKIVKNLLKNGRIFGTKTNFQNLSRRIFPFSVLQLPIKNHSKPASSFWEKCTKRCKNWYSEKMARKELEHNFQ